MFTTSFEKIAVKVRDAVKFIEKFKADTYKYNPKDVRNSYRSQLQILSKKHKDRKKILDSDLTDRSSLHNDYKEMKAMTEE
jgi:hypothetical protein